MLCMLQKIKYMQTIYILYIYIRIYMSAICHESYYNNV